MQELIHNKVFYDFLHKVHKFSTHTYKLTGENSDEATAQNEFQKNKESLENIENVKNHLKVKRLFLLNQVHGNDVYLLDKYEQLDNIPAADSIVTNLRNIALGIQTADCAPVLISDSEGEVIAALHCGWKSAISNIIPKTIDTLNKLSNTKLYKAIIGPCIMKESYEVSHDFREIFLQESSENQRFFYEEQDQKLFFDLPTYVEFKLKKNNVNDVYFIGEDTYKNQDKYFSYRFNMHKHKVDDGKRMLSVIFIK